MNAQVDPDLKDQIPSEEASARVYVLEQLSSPSSKDDNNTDVATLFDLTVLQDLMQENDSLRVSMLFSFSDTPIGKNIKMRLGNPEDVEQYYDVFSKTVYAQKSFEKTILITNRGAVDTQIVGADDDETPMEISMDFAAADQHIQLLAWWDAAGSGVNNITVERVIVERIMGQ